MVYVFSLIYLTTREVVITIAATCSLAIPFFILFIYRDYDAEEAWNLNPLPTFVGMVDSRRFVMVVVLGQGSEADNADIGRNQSLLPSCLEANMTSSSSLLKTHDSWGSGSIDNMFLFPRTLLNSI
jgi:hypothetical protein